jgi:hypothetical protein
MVFLVWRGHRMRVLMDEEVVLDVDIHVLFNGQQEACSSRLTIRKLHPFTHISLKKSYSHTRLPKLAV